ncbi:MAG: hypothetical protein HKN27_08150 [Silicimonas sp.]|nr:hypothetical protein [Silicimonas sp.]
MAIEIDETILPRRLVFTVNADVEVHLAVANRRLQALLQPSPDVPGASDLADVAITDGKSPALVSLGELLRRIFAEATIVEIQSHRQIPGQFDAEIGAPAGGLAKAWKLEIVKTRVVKPEEILTTFLEQISDDFAEAWLRIEGENVTDQLGNADRLAALGEQAAVFLDGYFGKYDTLFKDGPKATATLVSPGAAAETAALFVEIGGVSAFVAAKSGCAAALAANWQAIVAE